MGYLSLAAFVVGLVFKAHWVGAAGDTASGIGSFFVGLAALFAAATSWMNNRKIGRGIDEVKAGAKKADEVSKAVGPAGGTTVLDLLQEIKNFETYQHTRNHDVLNHLAVLVLAVPMLTEAVERLLAKLKETP